LVKEKRKVDSAQLDKIYDKTESKKKKEKRDQFISQYHPPLITDNRTKRNKRKQTGEKRKQAAKLK